MGPRSAPIAKPTSAAAVAEPARRQAGNPLRAPTGFRLPPDHVVERERAEAQLREDGARFVNASRRTRPRQARGPSTTRLPRRPDAFRVEEIFRRRDMWSGPRSPAAISASARRAFRARARAWADDALELRVAADRSRRMRQALGRERFDSSSARGRDGERDVRSSSSGPKGRAAPEDAARGPRNGPAGRGSLRRRRDRTPRGHLLGPVRRSIVPAMAAGPVAGHLRGPSQRARGRFRPRRASRVFGSTGRRPERGRRSGRRRGEGRRSLAPLRAFDGSPATPVAAAGKSRRVFGMGIR